MKSHHIFSLHNEEPEREEFGVIKIQLPLLNISIFQMTEMFYKQWSLFFLKNRLKKLHELQISIGLDGSKSM